MRKIQKKTSFFFKLFFLIGFSLLIFFILQSQFPFIKVNEATMGTILALSILFLGLSMLILFFNLQFAKLAEISEEIERENGS